MNQEVLDQLKELNRKLEVLLVTLQSMQEWIERNYQYPRQVEVVTRNR